MNPETVTRRPVTDADTPFLYSLYADVRAAELAQTPWNEEQKRAFLDHQFRAQMNGYRGMFPGGTHEIICHAGEPVGRVYWAVQDGLLHLLDMTIAPEQRNGGLGGVVLQTLVEMADREGRPITIYVESFNPAARFFARFGFEEVGRDGFLVEMERQPRKRE